MLAVGTTTLVTRKIMDTFPTRAAYSVPEVMVLLGINRDRVYELIRDRQLPARKLGRRTLVTRTDLENFLQALPRLRREPEIPAA
jgi:excisionase family DNA binding protein